MTTSCATAIHAMLSGPPGLPPVDEHITREDLHLHKLATMRREARRQQFRIKGTAEKAGPGAKDKLDFTEAEIQSVVQFIDSFGNGDGEISLDEITAAFRKCHRAKATQSDEQEGRRLVKLFLEILDVNDLTIEDWFGRLSDKSTGNGTITTLELKSGLEVLTADIPEMRLNDVEMMALLRFIDTSGDGDLSEVEIEWAIKRASIDPESERILNKAGDLMAQLDQYMQKKNMRVVDLFNALDTAQTGSVTSGQFRDGLVAIFGESSSLNKNQSSYPVWRHAGLAPPNPTVLHTFDTYCRKGSADLAYRLPQVAPPTAPTDGAIVAEVMIHGDQQVKMAPYIDLHSYMVAKNRKARRQQQRRNLRTIACNSPMLADALDDSWLQTFDSVFRKRQQMLATS